MRSAPLPRVTVQAPETLPGARMSVDAAKSGRDPSTTGSRPTPNPSGTLSWNRAGIFRREPGRAGPGDIGADRTAYPHRGSPLKSARNTRNTRNRCGYRR